MPSDLTPECERAAEVLEDYYDTAQECADDFEACMAEGEDRLWEALYDLSTGQISSAVKNFYRGMTRDCKVSLNECILGLGLGYPKIVETFFRECVTCIREPED
jgi:hypothetical protein